MLKIKVSEKALAHLSRGLYRSPASALRELVSNAWDANATEVSINTNYPNFLMLSIDDDGDGFSKDEFGSLMEGGIGNSEKRTQQRYLINDRPVIGRLGIGMLGIAQICGAFRVISRPRCGEPFQARVRMYDLLKEKLDQDDNAIVIKEVVNIGEYEFEELDPAPKRYGTTIIADDVHPTFSRSFQESLSLEKYREPPRDDWLGVIKILRNVRSLQELGDYWRLLWELSASCPLPYVNPNALPEGLVAEEQAKLLGYNFRVLLDGISLKKPILLEGNTGGYTIRKIETERRMVYGRELVFHGYLVVQEGLSLRPDELRGIMLRVRNVGIGYYDQSLLDYRINEGPRSRWLTGEIFVDSGLEDALNIDRDSFNRFHPEFRAVQKIVHELLQRVFSETYKKIDIRSSAQAKAKENRHIEHLQTVVSGFIGSPLVIRRESAGRKLGEPPQVSVTENTTNVELVIPAPEITSTKISYQDLAIAILAVYEIAMRQNTPDQQRRVFTELLLQLLKGW
ncbi:MAG: ATP-binding protein [Armatimonadota bacterium]